MSIWSFPISGANAATPALSMLNQLQSGGPDFSSFLPASLEQSSASASPQNSTTNLSDAIMRLLLETQNQSASATQAQSTSASSSTMITPLQQLFSAIDTDGDGTITKSEMETYIEGFGGTANEADALYNGLTQNGTQSLTETQLASDLNPQPSASSLLLRMLSTLVQATPDTAQNAANTSPASPFETRMSDRVMRYLVRAEALSPASQSAMISSSTMVTPLQQLFSTIDTSGDGTISQAEMENYIGGLGGTKSEADALYNGLTQNGSETLTAAQLSSDLHPRHFRAVGDFAGGSFANQISQSSQLIAMLSTLASATPGASSTSSS